MQTATPPAATASPVRSASSKHKITRANRECPAALYLTRVCARWSGRNAGAKQSHLSRNVAFVAKNIAIICGVCPPPHARVSEWAERPRGSAAIVNTCAQQLRASVLRQIRVASAKASTVFQNPFRTKTNAARIRRYSQPCFDACVAGCEELLFATLVRSGGAWWGSGFAAEG